MKTKASAIFRNGAAHPHKKTGGPHFGGRPRRSATRTKAPPHQQGSKPLVIQTSSKPLDRAADF